MNAEDSGLLTEGEKSLFGIRHIEDTPQATELMSLKLTTTVTFPKIGEEAKSIIRQMDLDTDLKFAAVF